MMLNRPSRVNLVAWGTSTLLLIPVIVLCVCYVDVPLAYFIKTHLFTRLHWSKLGSEIPDLLFLVVVLTTFVALVLYQVRIRRGIRDAVTRLERLLAWGAPVSYLVKGVLKFVFGRVNTRVWLEEPNLYGFYWFQKRQGCEGFPSGHMVVIVTLLAAFWRFNPKCRPWCLLLGVGLAAALIATDYHFLSDVLAGAYLGVLVEAAVFWLLSREPRRLTNPVV